MRAMIGDVWLTIFEVNLGESIFEHQSLKCDCKQASLGLREPEMDLEVKTYHI